MWVWVWWGEEGQKSSKVQEKGVKTYNIEIVQLGLKIRLPKRMGIENMFELVVQTWISLCTVCCRVRW